MIGVTAVVSTPQPLTALSAEQRMHIEHRALVREFLRTIPADEPGAVLELQLLDGSVRQLTRGALTARIRWLRPRMRRIVEQIYIGHVGRDVLMRQLCCSLKTIERDQQEALDILLGEATEPCSEDA